jgi:Flp pilus assembly protein TadG
VALRRLQSSRRDWVDDESGQALVEAALVLPVILLVVFGVVMAGRVTHAKVAVQASAREASRALATAASESQGLTDAVEAGRSTAEGYGLGSERLSVDASSNGFERGGTASAEVTYRVPLAGLPLLNQVDISVSSTHTERIDLYRSREVTSP